jgi:DegV family protein with EDD domain
MTVRIVTDSTCDLPASVLQELEISMVPADVVHRGRAYKDRVDISHDDLFDLLERDYEVPTTAAPPPASFTEVYEGLARETDEIVSLHVTSEHSAICDAARRGSENVTKRCQIEVIDSRQLSMGLGFLAMDAAGAAKRGASLTEVAELIRREIPLIRLYAVFDTMRYLMLGGRVNKVIGTLGTTLKVKLLLTVRDGRLRPAGIARTYPAALDRLASLTEQLEDLEEWSVAYTTNEGDARVVAERLGHVGSPRRVPLTRVGPGLGVHGGPGALLTAAKLQGP